MIRSFYVFGIVCFCLSLIDSGIYAQGIKGRIIDKKGKPVTDASLFIKELKMGTTADDNGLYELKLPEGTWTCTFQCLGYESVTRRVMVGSNVVTLDISLSEKAYEIKEVIISDKREDPAYGIMRRAIGMAPYYLNQVSEYKADVYLKGSLHIIKISSLMKRLAKEELEKIKEGSTYVEESFSEIEFTAPNKYRQKVLKRTSSMPEGSGSNATEQVTVSIYDPEAVEPFISPLSSNAFAHYKFRYEGFVEEDNMVINKIKIIPKQKSKQLVSGYIFIADNYWNVTSVDVQGQFIIGGDYRLQINFGEVNRNVRLPVSYRIDFDGSILGNKGNYRYVSSLKYTYIVENESLQKPNALLLAERQRDAMQKLQAPPLALSDGEKSEGGNKTSRKIEKLTAKEDLSNREAYQLARLMKKEAEKKENDSLDLTGKLREDYRVTVDSNASKRDTAYWEKMRPVPLAPNELQSYREKEVLSEQSKDMTKRAKKSQSPFVETAKKVLLGTKVPLGKKGGVLEYRGLRPSRLGFNTVDGFFVGQKLIYSKDFAERRLENRLTITPEAVWAINRKALMWRTEAVLSYAPKRRGNAKLSFGQTSTDFNESTGMYPFENTFASLFFRRNYLKLYDRSFIEAYNSIEIANGLQGTINVQYSRRKMLGNNSDYSFFYRDSREYTPNIPKNIELTELPIDHDATVFFLNVDYTPRQYYRIDRNNRKRAVRSDFPTFSVSWRKGVKSLFGSDVDFDLLTVGIRQSLEPGLMQQLYYSVGFGMFVNDNGLFFPDFRHFRTVEIPVTGGTIENQTFHLLPYYRYDTSDKYAEAHVSFTTPFLILKYLPFIGNRLWTEGLHLDYLYTPEFENYAELGYSIGLVWRAGVFVGFENFNYRSIGAKVSLPIGLFFK